MSFKRPWISRWGISRTAKSTVTESGMVAAKPERQVREDEGAIAGGLWGSHWHGRIAVVLGSSSQGLSIASQTH